MTSSKNFEIGDIVELKSNGTKMNIKEVKETSYVCYWDDRSGKYCDSEFHADLLIKYIEPTLTGDNIHI